MALCGTNQPPSIGDITILVDGNPISEFNPAKPLSVVTITGDIFNPDGVTTYTFYRDGFSSSPAQDGSNPDFLIEDFNPSSSSPSNYPIPGEILFCTITCVNPIDAVTQTVEIGEIHGLLPDLSEDLLTDFDLNITLNQIVNVGDTVTFTPKNSTTHAGNPDGSIVNFVVNGQNVVGSPLQYTVTGDETDCLIVVNSAEISNSDPNIPNTGTVTVDYNIEIAGVQGGACTDELGGCCATGAYNPATGITQGSCLLSTESECLSLSTPGYWSAGGCPDCSSDLLIGTPCCPEYPTGRCCRGSDNAVPCEEGVIQSVCESSGGRWDRNKTCSSCFFSDPDAVYSGCVSACCESGFVCNDNILLHNCAGNHFVGYNCSDCGTPGNPIAFDNNCCEPSGDPCENGNTVVYKTVFGSYTCRDLTINTNNGNSNYPNDVNGYNSDSIVQDSEVFCKSPLTWNRFATGGCSPSRHNCKNNNENSCKYREFFDDAGPPLSYCNLNGICSCFVAKETRGCVPDPPVWEPQFPGQQPPLLGPFSNDELVKRCQQSVCIIDSWCCQNSWDDECVSLALAECTGVLSVYQANIFGYLYSNSDNMSCGTAPEGEPCIDTSSGYLDFRECMDKLGILSSFSTYKDDECPGNWEGVP